MPFHRVFGLGRARRRERRLTTRIHEVRIHLIKTTPFRFRKSGGRVAPLVAATPFERIRAHVFGHSQEERTFRWEIRALEGGDD